MTMETGKDLAKQVVAELINSGEFHTLLKSLMMDTIEKKLTSLDSKVEQVKKDFNEKMGTITTDNEKIRGELHEVRVQNEDLTKKNVKLRKQLDTCINNNNSNFHANTTLHQEQLRNSLRFTGVPELPIQRDPDTLKVIPEDMEKTVLDVALKSGVTLTAEDIDSARRIPKLQTHTTTPRAIEVRLTRHIIRQKILTSRRNLKGTGIGIHEELSKVHQFIYDQARDMVRNVEKAKTVWTWNGVSTVLFEDDGQSYKYQVRSVEEIRKAAEKHS
jgi:hypothetical protein